MVGIAWTECIGCAYIVLINESVSKGIGPKIKGNSFPEKYRAIWYLRWTKFIFLVEINTWFKMKASLFTRKHIKR